MRPQAWSLCLLGLCLINPVATLNMRQAVRTTGVSLMQTKVDLKSNATAVHAANASAAGSKQPVAELASAPAVVQAKTSAVMSFRIGKDEVALAVSLLVAGVAMLLAFLAAALLVCAAYDLTARWIHWARFRSCEAKVKRAHEAFHSKTGELPLCPYCVEPCTSKRGPSKVVFLCGHRFHVECSNKWFKENPESTTHCPICRDVETVLPLCRPCEPGKPKAIAEKPEATTGRTLSKEQTVMDGAFAFILHNLRRLHPQMVTEDNVERWMKCNTEIWLSELTCPRYNSVLVNMVNLLLGKQAIKA